MSISELIKAVGDQNIEVQFLHECMKSASLRKDHSEISFCSSRDRIQDMMQNPPRHTCVIMWLPTERLPK